MLRKMLMQVIVGQLLIELKKLLLGCNNVLRIVTELKKLLQCEYSRSRCAKAQNAPRGQ